ncbi:MAG: TIGR03790 family protein, partial [Armatimonadetes bacterium]|nr:TIGR03790 family protein [Armatimonadota bacterium]
QQVVDTVYANQYWWSYAPFRHEDRGGYLVTRLDGYTEADAKALVDHALGAPTNNRILLDAVAERGIPANQPKCLLFPDGAFNPDYQLEYADFDADMVRASQILANRPDFSVTLDITSTFMGSSEPLLGYVSWGSNDGHFSLSTYRSLTFTPRALADTAVSSSGRTFLPTTGGQSLIADLVAKGVTGAKGYVSEPFLDAISSPTLLFDFYTSGKNLAESFYAASRFVKWKDIVLGDPLCRLEGTAAANIAAAKKLQNGKLVSLLGRVVTAGTEDFGDCFYIEDQNRASGIQVYIGNALFNIPRGSVVNVRGVLSTRNGERCIINPNID